MFSSKSKSLQTAQKLVSAPVRTGYAAWEVYSPYNFSDLDGPSTTIRSNSYWTARDKRAQVVADIALHLMGHHGADTHGLGGSALDRVSDWLTKNQG